MCYRLLVSRQVIIMGNRLHLITIIKMWKTAKYLWLTYLLACWSFEFMFAMLNCLSSLHSLFLSVSVFFFCESMVSVVVVCLQSVPATANSVLFILYLIGYNNLIRHSNSKKVDILLLALLEDWEEIITDRNTKTNYQVINSANRPLTVM